MKDTADISFLCPECGDIKTERACDCGQMQSFLCSNCNCVYRVLRCDPFEDALHTTIVVKSGRPMWKGKQ